MTKIKKLICYWCGKPHRNGMHDLCWVALKRLALS